MIPDVIVDFFRTLSQTEWIASLSGWFNVGAIMTAIIAYFRYFGPKLARSNFLDKNLQRIAQENEEHVKTFKSILELYKETKVELETVKELLGVAYENSNLGETPKQLIKSLIDKTRINDMKDNKEELLEIKREVKDEAISHIQEAKQTALERIRDEMKAE